MRTSFAVLAFAWLAAGPGLAQQTSTYLYDVHGRLVTNATAAVSGSSQLNRYTYDSADNRGSRNTRTIPGLQYNILRSGDIMLPTQSIRSYNGHARLELRQSGELVIICRNEPLAVIYGPTGTAGQLNMQPDGNAVLYNFAPSPLWASNTNGYPGSYLLMGEDGAVRVMYQSTQVWTSGTYCEEDEE